MYRVELKGLKPTGQLIKVYVTNVPCGVERASASDIVSVHMLVTNVPCGVERKRIVLSRRAISDYGY